MSALTASDCCCNPLASVSRVSIALCLSCYLLWNPLYFSPPCTRQPERTGCWSISKLLLMIYCLNLYRTPSSRRCVASDNRYIKQHTYVTSVYLKTLHSRFHSDFRLYDLLVYLLTSHRLNDTILVAFLKSFGVLWSRYFPVAAASCIGPSSC